MNTGKGSRGEESEWSDSVMNKRAMGPKTLASSSHGQRHLRSAECIWNAGTAPDCPPAFPVTDYLKPRLPLLLLSLLLHCHYTTVIRSQQIHTLLSVFSYRNVNGVIFQQGRCKLLSKL